MQQLRKDQGLAWVETGYLFTTRCGTPIEPRNLTRMFGQICEKHGLRATSGSTTYDTRA